MYKLLFSAVLSRMDPEKAHHRAFFALRLATSLGRVRTAIRALTWRGYNGVPQTVMGINFPSRFGLAAGFDKNAVAPASLADLGFGFVEIGTVTGEPQPGNPAPRLVRLVKDRALINRMGFNNEGAAAVARRLAKLRTSTVGTNLVVGVNIGKTKNVAVEDAVADYVKSAKLLSPFADYLVINVSSPNTPGLRNLQSVDLLEPICSAVQQAANASAVRDVPLLVKIAPDLANEDIVDVCRMVERLNLAGVVATNTTITRPDTLRTPPAEVEAAGAGGLSGPILRERSEQVLRLLRQSLPASATIISVGGIVTGADARRRLELGADLLQGYTPFIYEGPLWPSRIRRAISGR